jgi:hypothetical protein
VCRVTRGADPALTDAAARRMSNQLTRAYRGTYGARTGLRSIVLALARQMIRDGVSPEATARAFERCVLDHSARAFGDAPPVTSGASHPRVLIDLTRECVAEAALESAAPGAHGGKPSSS